MRRFIVQQKFQYWFSIKKNGTIITAHVIAEVLKLEKGFCHVTNAESRSMVKKFVLREQAHTLTQQ